MVTHSILKFIYSPLTQLRGVGAIAEAVDETVPKKQRFLGLQGFAGLEPFAIAGRIPRLVYGLLEISSIARTRTPGMTISTILERPKNSWFFMPMRVPVWPPRGYTHFCKILNYLSAPQWCSDSWIDTAGDYGLRQHCYSTLSVPALVLKVWPMLESWIVNVPPPVILMWMATGPSIDW